MSDLLGTNVSEELAIKVAELESLKKSYEDFIESSGSLEKELEDALKDSEDKCIELSKKKAIAEEKFSQLQDKYSTSGAQLINCQKEVSNLTEKLMQAESKKIELERIVDELQEMVRILEATETDLTHKVQIAEEDIIFLHTDLEEAKAASNDNEHRLKAELTELQAELARFEANGSHPVDGIEGAIKGAHETAIDDEEKQRQLELIDELEIEVEDLTERLTLSEQQNQQLNEEVSRLADELIQVHESKTAKSEVVPVSSDVESAHFEELAQLKSKLESTDLQLKAVSSSLEETKDEVSDLSNQLEQQIEKYIQLKLEYDDTMIALNSAKMNEKIANDALLLANENRNNSNSERVQNLEIELRLRDEAIQALHEKVADLEARIQEAKESETPVALPIAVQDPMMPITSDAPTSVIKVLPTNTLTSEDGHSEWIEERESLLREVEYLRNAINTTLVKSQASPRHSPVKTSSQCLMAMPDSEELAIPAIHILDTEEVSKRALDSVIGSGDLEKLKSMLLSKSTQLDATRKSNAKLLQKLQAARGNIQVCCRPRPPSASELATSKQGMQMSVDVIDDNEIACLDKRSESWKSFLFDRVWRMDSSQQDVFADVEPLVLSVIEGYNTCLFAYGQTGSGKTFTMNGYGEEYGVSYRTLHKIFEVLKQKESNAEAVQRSKTILSEASQVRINANAASKKLFSDEANSYNSAVATSADDINTDTLPFSYKVEVSMMEIYNDQVYDLLSGAAEESLDIRQAGDGTVHVPGLKQVPVFGLEDVLQVFAKGSANRATAATNLNELSSRSHSVLSVDVTTVTNGTPVRAKLFLVDLAGSERAGKSGVTGAQMKETQFINKSLSALGDVMEALDQKAKHVPYRNSKLTYLLQDSLGGNSRTMMIVTVCPTESTIEETMFTLGFASRVRNVSLGVARKNINVKNFEEALKIAKNEIRDGKKSRLQLEETINDLKKQLKKTSEKMTTQTESKSKAYDEAKKSNELQLQLIGKTNQELTARLQEEREAKLKVQQEVELMQKTLKKANDQLKENLRERERLLLVVKQREDASIKQQEKDTDSGKDSARNYDKTEKSAVTPMTPNSALTSSTLSRPAVRASAAALSNSSGHLGPPRRDPRESVSSFAIPSRVPVRRLTTTTATSGIALATGRSDEDNTSLNGDVITQSSAVSTPSKSVTSVYDRLTLSNASQRSSRKADIPTTAFGSSIAPSSSRAARSYNKPPPMALTDVNTFVSASVTDSDSNPTATASLSPSHIPVSSMASLRLSISSRSKEALQRHQERMDKYRQSHGTSS